MEFSMVHNPPNLGIWSIQIGIYLIVLEASILQNGGFEVVWF